MISHISKSIDYVLLNFICCNSQLFIINCCREIKQLEEEEIIDSHTCMHTHTIANYCMSILTRTEYVYTTQSLNTFVTSHRYSKLNTCMCLNILYTYTLMGIMTPCVRTSIVVRICVYLYLWWNVKYWKGRKQAEVEISYDWIHHVRRWCQAWR